MNDLGATLLYIGISAAVGHRLFHAAWLPHPTDTQLATVFAAILAAGAIMGALNVGLAVLRK